MDFLTSTDPIIACSSGAISNSAIAVIRISGLECLDHINFLFNIDLSTIKPRYAYFCSLISKDEIIDEVVLTWFKAPNSFNGENIIELGVHGNILNIDRIIEIFNGHGIRSASPGEFTYRALKNKKLSLSQVEGLDLLLNASSSFGLNQGHSLMSGKLQKDYAELYQAFLNHKSAVELSIDFLEDMGTEQASSQFNSTLDILSNAIEKLASHVSTESLNLLTPEVALIGLPNAGKSSLFNLLLKDQRAIVSSIAGTTRDYISEKIKIKNNFFNLVDTAGIRKSNDIIESEGIKRSIEIANSSFFKVLVINPFEFKLIDFEQLDFTKIDLIVFSHSDKHSYKSVVKSAITNLSESFGPIEPISSDPMGAYKSGPIEPSSPGPMGANKSGPIEPSSSGPMGANTNGPIEPINNNGTSTSIYFIEASLIDSNGEEALSIKNEINKKFNNIILNEPVIIERHKDLINKISLLFSDYRDLSCSIDDISIISSELNTVGHCISELIGIVSPDDILHNIFDNFCIGK